MVEANAVGLRRLKNAMLAAEGRVFVQVRRALRDHGNWFTARMIEERLTGPPGGIGPPLGLRRRSGALARSLDSRVESNGTSLRKLKLRVFFAGRPAVYARAHDQGATIRPVNAKYLTIPLPDNLTKSGVARYKSAKKLRARYPGRTFIRRSRAGNLVIGFRKPTGKKGVLWLWILKESVKLRPRLGFVSTFRDQRSQRDRETRLNAAIRRGLRGVVGAP